MRSVLGLKTVVALQISSLNIIQQPSFLGLSASKSLALGSLKAQNQSKPTFQVSSKRLCQFKTSR